jgi:hypothetical protein
MPYVSVSSVGLATTISLLLGGMIAIKKWRSGASDVGRKGGKGGEVFRPCHPRHLPLDLNKTTQQPSPFPRFPRCTRWRMTPPLLTMTVDLQQPMIPMTTAYRASHHLDSSLRQHGHQLLTISSVMLKDWHTRLPH